MAGTEDMKRLILLLALILPLQACTGVSGFRNFLFVVKHNEAIAGGLSGITIHRKEAKPTKCFEGHASPFRQCDNQRANSKKANRNKKAVYNKYDVYAFCNSKYPQEAWDSEAVTSCIQVSFPNEAP